MNEFDYNTHFNKAIKKLEQNLYNPYKPNNYSQKIFKMNNLLLTLPNKLTIKDFEEIRSFALSEGGFITNDHRRKFLLKRGEVSMPTNISYMDKKTRDTIHIDAERSLINGFDFLTTTEK
jgi:hypothetical protein